MAPYGSETVKSAFQRDGLLFFNEPGELKNYLENINLKSKNLLMMSSGNFGGIDLKQLSVKIL
jgi:UDP-N-acetylmuramate: L-alanyl-gamma-D-glutamyl-meso-diaminopimelate ligase